MRKSADYQGYSNWETWNTSLMLDNDYDTYKKSRELFEKGMTVEQLRDFLIQYVIGPHNRNAIEDAKEWNSIPKDERIDYHYEDLKNKSPEAADFVDALGFGKDVEDSEPELIDPDLVNYQEIWDHLYDEIEGNNEYDRQMKDLQSQGLSWTTNHDLMTNQMRDAFYRYHGAIPEEELEAMPGSQWDNPGAYHNINVTTPWEQLEPAVMEGSLLGKVDRETRMKIWERQNELYPNMSHYEREHVIDWEKDPVVQQLIESDPNIQKLKQEGYTQRLHDLTWQTINAIHRSQPTPYADVMRQALEQRGYTPEQIQEMFKPQWRWQPNPQYRDPNAPYDQRTNPGDWINLSSKMDQAQIDKSLDQPGDMTLPEHWGSTEDEWNPFWENFDDANAFESRRPYLIDLADIEHPDPPIWIGELGQYHDESPFYNSFEKPYFGEIWETQDPPTFTAAGAPNDVYDDIAKAHAERAYYSQQDLKKRASDGADYWTQSQDDWWGTQNDSLFNVNVPGETPGMRIDEEADSLHCPHCMGPMHGLKCPSCGFEKQATDMVPSGQVHVMPEEGRDEWGEGGWDTDTFLDHRMLNKSLREQQQAHEYLDFMKRHKRAEDAAWPEMGIKEAADNVPGMPVSDSGHWVWLDGKVGFGGAHHEIAEKLADELGYGKDDKAYVANWLARGHCPQDRAVAVGTFKNNRPYIWNSTRDRNHIWDAVMQAREQPTASI